MYDPVLPLQGIYLKEIKSTISKIYLHHYLQQSRLWNNIFVCWWLGNTYIYMLFSQKIKKILTFYTTWVDYEDTVVSKINHTDKDKYYMISLLYEI